MQLSSWNYRQDPSLHPSHLCLRQSKTALRSINKTLRWVTQMLLSLWNILHFAAETPVKSSCGFVTTYFYFFFKCPLCKIDSHNVNSLSKHTRRQESVTHSCIRISREKWTISNLILCSKRNFWSHLFARIKPQVLKVLSVHKISLSVWKK